MRRELKVCNMLARGLREQLGCRGLKGEAAHLSSSPLAAAGLGDGA